MKTTTKTKTAPRASVEYFPIAGRPGLYSWRVRAANGRIVASGESNGFSGTAGAIRAFERTQEIIATLVRVEFVDG